jgi:hypothetical protein
MSPAAGSIVKGSTVVITGPAGSTIYYTTNGSNPTPSTITTGVAGSGTASVVVSASEYVRAIAVYKSGTQIAQSAVTTATYSAH